MDSCRRCLKVAINLILILAVVEFSQSNGHSYSRQYIDAGSDTHLHPRTAHLQEPSTVHSNGLHGHIVPVTTYQAKSNFNHIPRLQQPAPVTYQTYDKRALYPSQPDIQPESYVVDQTPKYKSYVTKRTYTPQYESSSNYNQIKQPSRTVYHSYRPSQSYQQPKLTATSYDTDNKNEIRYDYNRGGSSGRSGFQTHSIASRRSHVQPQSRSYTPKSFYGQFAPKRTYELTRRRPSRYYDPCIRLYDGQYILNHDFKKLFPYTDNMCYFVKCANKKAYLNACGPATRNDKTGDGFCSHLDLEGFCGPSLHEYHERKQKKKDDHKHETYKYTSHSDPSSFTGQSSQRSHQQHY